MTKAIKKQKTEIKNAGEYQITEEQLIAFAKEVFDDSGIRDKVIARDKEVIQSEWDKWFLKAERTLEECTNESLVYEALQYFEKLNAYDFVEQPFFDQHWFDSDVHTYADVISAMASLAHQYIESNEDLIKKYQDLTTATLISLNA